MNKDLGASAKAEPGSRASTEPSSTVSALTGFDPTREAVVVALIYDDGEHEPHEASKEAVCLTAADAHAYVAATFPEARRVGDDELAGYDIVVNGEPLDMTAVLWRVPLWSPAIAAATRRAKARVRRTSPKVHRNDYRTTRTGAEDGHGCDREDRGSVHAR